MITIDFENDLVSQESPVVLSICIPFYECHAAQLMNELIRQAEDCSSTTEILLLDDGSRSVRYINSLKDSIIVTKKTKIKIFRSDINIGRAAARNILAQRSAGTHLLFIDSDMLPDADDFLVKYITHIRPDERDVVLGGRSYKRIDWRSSKAIDKQLYLFYSSSTECLSAELRSRHPERYLFTNNIMVSRSVFQEIPMDEGFSGWGYEDIDWGIRLRSKAVTIVHIDNTATHRGIICDNELLVKYYSSVNNFLRLIKKHPDSSRSLPIVRASQNTTWLGPLLLAIGKFACKSVILNKHAPLRIRMVGLQGFKVCLYSRAIYRLRHNAN